MSDMRESLFERMSSIAREPRKPKMQTFNKIEGSVAIVRVGIYMKQLELYARGDRVYLKLSGGFARVTARFGTDFGTVNPSIKLVEYEAEGVREHGTGNNVELRYSA